MSFPYSFENSTHCPVESWPNYNSATPPTFSPSYSEVVTAASQFLFLSCMAFQLVQRMRSVWREIEAKRVAQKPVDTERLLLNQQYKEVKETPESYMQGAFRSLIPICPITKFPVRFAARDPTCGQIFEKEALEHWVRLHHASPLTRKPLALDQIYSDQKTQFWIDFFLKSVTGYLQKKTQEKQQVFEHSTERDK